MRTIEKLKHLTNNEKKALKELKEEILKLYPDAKLILFGSKARGDFDEESDIDVLALVQELNFNKKETIWDISNEINLKYDTSLSVVTVDKNDFNSFKLEVIPFFINIQKDGIFLWKKKRIFW